MQSIEQEKITIVEVQSGKIELVVIQHLPTIQFNCSCEDALPYCHAVCCKHRPDYNIALDDEEIKKFADTSIRHPTIPHINLMAYSKDGHCVHLENCKCSVHEAKPSICKQWHCSPGGVGEGIVIRDEGWSLVPVHGDLQQI